MFKDMNDPITVSQVIQWAWDHIWQILVFLGFFIELVPIKINPISFITNILFKPIREEMKAMKTELNNNINSVKTELENKIDKIQKALETEQKTTAELIQSTELAEISRLRWEIIEFANSIDNAQLHVRDEYRHIFDSNRRYHNLIKKYNLENGIVDEEMDKIKNHYDENKDTTSVYF